MMTGPLEELQQFILDQGLDPADPRTLIEVGTICLERRLFKEGVHFLSQASARLPDDSDLLARLAAGFYAAGDFGAAEKALARAVSLNPLSITFRTQLAKTQESCDRLSDAEATLRDALKVFPEDPGLASDLGKLLRKKENYSEALYWLDQAIQKQPGIAATHEAYATTLLESNQIDQAIHHFEITRRLGLNSPECLYRLGTAHLLQGRLREGFALYEERFNISHFNSKKALPACSIPLWKGEALAGKSILILPEQGKGDNIQFVRYARLLAQQGAHVLMAVDPPLRLLFENIPDIHRVVSAGQWVNSDFLCPLLSLPHRCGTTIATIPASIPYLKAPFKAALPSCPPGTLKVGLVWKSSPGFIQARQRDVPIESLQWMFSMPGCNFFSLQYGPAAPQITPFLAPNVVDLTPGISNFADTAAYLMEMDLLITVDTAGAHLAGALGRPVWTFLPYIPDWRWMLNTATTPWYPTMRLYRQVERDNWKQPLELLKQDFIRLVARSQEQFQSSNALTVFS